MKPYIILSSFLLPLFLLVFTLTLPSQAKAGDFEVSAGLGWLADVGNGPDGHGINVRLNAAYLYNPWVAFLIEQDLGGTFWKKSPSHFHGATIIAARFTYPDLNGLDIWGQIGLGGAYYAKHHNHEDWSRGFFAFRLGLGATYKMDTNLGLGANFDYTICAGNSDDGHHFHKGSDNAHALNLQIHIAYYF